jgi:AMP deaminase
MRHRHLTSQPLRSDTQSIHYITVISNQSSPTTLPTNLEFHPPTADSGSKITAAVDHGSLPEQKIFPGIVHERARRGSVITPAAGLDGNQGLYEAES